MTKVHATCRTCEKDVKIPATKTTLVANETYQTWTLTFLCKGCGRVELVDPKENVVALMTAGAQVLITRAAKPSPRDISSPPITEKYIQDAVEFMKSPNFAEFAA